jgi:hypothetical protein
MARGVPRAAVYDITMYVLCALLAIGFLCNLLVRPVNDKHFMKDEELKAQTRSMQAAAGAPPASELPVAAVEAGNRIKLILAWLAVGIPLAWGVY